MFRFSLSLDLWPAAILLKDMRQVYELLSSCRITLVIPLFNRKEPAFPFASVISSHFPHKMK
ncbi:hypothetical protein B14911_17640 [Bacillus sp. NRRL B-14911]|nr:hypothetical protein B14911_17640 [Bacillus sp. NRRL B-14911]